MTVLVRGLFAALLVATFGAFFVAQRLKSSPPLVQQVGVDPVLSPNQDGRFERARVSFQLKRTDVVDVQIIDARGDEVRELASSRRAAAGEQVRVRWAGRDEEGEPARDGTYRARIVLRRQGRSVTLPRTIRLDTTPPQPEVLSIGPESSSRPVAELLPRADGRPAEIRFSAPGSRPSVEIWRTDLDRPRLVEGLEIDTDLEGERLPGGIGRTTWDGTREGRRASPGTYVAVVRSRDSAGNIGRSVPERTLRGRPRRGQILPGKGGITVRYLGVQPSLLPVRAGRSFDVAIDARGATYNWSLRRVGAPEPVRRSRRAQGGRLRRQTPDGESGLFLFEARTRTRAAAVPVAVDDRRDNRVLVVLPATTWQGRNELDDDGDGLPNTLGLGVPVRLSRVFADGLPAELAANAAPLLAHLDRQGLRYDLTTDTALAVGAGPQLDGHRGVMLAGSSVWLTEDVRRQLRSFVAGGGTLASLGTGALRAEVRQTPKRLLEAERPGPEDLFGARIAPVRRETVDLSILEDDERVQLFAGGEGLFPGVEAWEATRTVGPEARLASSAVTPDNQEVVVAARFGDGLVVRTGIPGFATRLSGDPASAELLGRIWTLLEDRMTPEATDPILAAGAIVTALLAGVALAVPLSARLRAAAMVLALALTPALLLAEIWDSEQVRALRDDPALAGGVAAAGIVAVAVLAVLVRRRPHWLPVALVAALPFRVPIAAGGTTSSLLVPLYAVIAAGVLAYAVPRLLGREPAAADEPEPAGPWLRRLLGVAIVLYAIQAAYSADFERALQQVVFFYVPFALMATLLARATWSRELLLRLVGVLVGLAVIFVLVGFWEYATRSLLLNPKVIASNQFETYFRVNSLFFDPNIYGRFLAIVMLLVTAVLLWARTSRVVVGCGLLLALLWGGLVLTLSQSSFAALLGGLVVLAALRWGVRPAAIAVGAAAIAATAVALVAPAQVGLGPEANTSGRVALVEGGVGLFADAPVVGHGSGAFRREYRAKENASGERATNASHTQPVTVAAEQGVIGLAVYLALVAAALLLVLRGARESVARAGVAAAFVALTVHTLTYAAFLEDPLAWALLAAGVGLRSLAPADP